MTRITRQIRSDLDFYSFVKNLQKEINIESGKKPPIPDITIAILPIARRNRRDIVEKLLLG